VIVSLQRADKFFLAMIDGYSRKDSGKCIWQLKIDDRFVFNLT